MIRDLVSELRPRQWTKNLLLFAGVLFSRQAGLAVLLQLDEARHHQVAAGEHAGATADDAAAVAAEIPNVDHLPAQVRLRADHDCGGQAP